MTCNIRFTLLCMGLFSRFCIRALTTETGSDFGMAAAAGLYQSVVGFVMVILSNWAVRRIDPDRALF